MAHTPTPPARRYVPLDQCAAYLSCDIRTIRRMIAAGDITGYRVGKRMLRIDLNELDAILRPIPSAGDAA